MTTSLANASSLENLSRGKSAGEISWSVFDLDYTLIKKNSSFLFGAYLYKEGLMTKKALFASLWDYFLHTFFNFPLKKLHRRAFQRLFVGHSLAEWKEHAKLFVKRELSPHFNEEIVRRLRKSLTEEKATLILSSSPDFLVEEIAHALNVRLWKATSYNFETSSVDSIFDGKAKASYLQEYARRHQLSFSTLTVYSDSILDFPMLLLAARPIAVSPDRQLKKICLKKGWQMIV